MENKKKIFQVTKRYAIRQLDDRNWVIVRASEPKTVKGTAQGAKALPQGNKSVSEAFHGYYQSLRRAKEAMAELAGLESADYKELQEWIDQIERI
jgi:hypothetical protein